MGLVPGDRMNRIRFYYLLTGSAQGIYLPFINVYFEQNLGLAGRAIGVLAAVAPLLTLLITPLWGSLADARGSRLRVLRLVLGGAAGGALLIALPDHFWQLLLAVALYNLFQIAIIPLGDGLVSAAAAERRVSYGSLRLWASIGFAAGGLLFGQIAARLGLRVLFPAYAALLALALVAAWRLVPHEPPAPPADSGRALALLRDPALARFLVVAALAAIGISTGYVFVYVFLGILGAGAGLMGVVSAVGAVAEVPAMRFSGRLIEKWGAPAVFSAGAALFGLGWGCYALLRDPALAPLVQVLNGAGMGLFWPAGVTFVARRAPAGRSATAQSLLNAATYGVAPLIASQLAGNIFDLAGVRAVLVAAAAFMAASVLAYALLRPAAG